jgi:hypothetical protein
METTKRQTRTATLKPAKLEKLKEPATKNKRGQKAVIALLGREACI